MTRQIRAPVAFLVVQGSGAIPLSLFAQHFISLSTNNAAVSLNRKHFNKQLNYLTSNMRWESNFEFVVFNFSGRIILQENLCKFILRLWNIEILLYKYMS